MYREPLTPWVDWPFFDATRVSPSDPPTDPEAEASVFFQYRLVDSGGGAITGAELIVHPSWMKRTDQLGVDARRAADDLRTAGAISLKLRAVRFDLEEAQTSDGTAHDRPFDRKLHTLIESTATVPIADLVAALNSRTDATLTLVITPPLPAETQLVVGRLRADRRAPLSPSDDELAHYSIRKPVLGEEKIRTNAQGQPIFTLAPGDVLDPRAWADRFPEATDPRTRPASPAPWPPFAPSIARSCRSRTTRRAFRQALRDLDCASRSGSRPGAGDRADGRRCKWRWSRWPSCRWPPTRPTTSRRRTCSTCCWRRSRATRICD